MCNRYCVSLLYLYYVAVVFHFSTKLINLFVWLFNPCPAELRYIFLFENSVDTEKPTDQDPHCYQCSLLINFIICYGIWEVLNLMNHEWLTYLVMLCF